MNHRTSSENHNEALAAVDALARKALDWVAPIRFGVAQTDSEREAVYRLRYEAVIEHGWMRPEDLPDGLERDSYDNHAVYIVGWDGDKLATSSRLILPDPSLVLPTEQIFDLRVEPRARVVDAGRFVVARQYSSIEHRVLAVLLAKTWLVMRECGYEKACAAFASNSMIRVYRHMGFQVSVLGPPRFYWGTQRFPILFDVADASPTLVQRWDAVVGRTA